MGQKTEIEIHQDAIRILQIAHQRIDRPSGWRTGSEGAYHMPTGPVCALGAIRWGGQVVENTYRPTKAQNKAIELLANAIGRSTLSYGGLVGAHGVIASFNDKSWAKFKVLRKLRKAIKLAKKNPPPPN